MTDTTTESPPPNRRKTAKARTASTVLSHARDLFQTQGYERATIRDVAKAANMSTGAVFANYENKVALYSAAFGHPPVTPEIGRIALKALRALLVDLDGENGTQAPVDQLAAIDHLRRHARDVLQLAGFPPLETQLDPEEHVLVRVMQAALEAPL